MYLTSINKPAETKTILHRKVHQIFRRSIFPNTYICTLLYFPHNFVDMFKSLSSFTEVFPLTEVFLTLTEVFPCFFLTCKANARLKLAKTGHGPHSSTLVCICVVRLLFVLFYALFVCKCVLPPGDNPTAVNKYHHHIGLPSSNEV